MRKDIREEEKNRPVPSTGRFFVAPTYRTRPPHILHRPVLRRRGEGCSLDCPLYWDGRRIGTLRVTPAGEDTCFTVDGTVPPGLYRVYARGRRGELLLGIWEGGTLRRRFSRSLVLPVGAVECGCVRSSPVEDWLPARPERFPGWPTEDGLCRRRGQDWELALPFAEDGPFPIPALFCLARIASVAGRRRAVFRFDGTGWPVVPKNG